MSTTAVEITRTATDEDKINAFNLIDAVAKLGWTVSGLYFSYRDEQHLCQLRRYIRMAKGVRRQRFETVTGLGDTLPLAVVRAVAIATEESEEDGEV